MRRDKMQEAPDRWERSGPSQADNAGGAVSYTPIIQHNAPQGNGPAHRAAALLQAAQPGNRHAALFDAAVILAEAGAGDDDARAFLMAGALALGLRDNSNTRKSITKGLARGRAALAARDRVLSECGYYTQAQQNATAAGGEL